MSCFRLHHSYYQKPIFRVLKGNCLTGEGATNLRAPGIDNERIKVAYNCIKINTDKQLFEGKVASTYTPDWKNIKDSSYGGISDKNGVVVKKDTIKLPPNINNVEDIKIDDDDFVITTINEDGTKTETKIPIKDLVPEKDKTNLEQSLTETSQTTTIKDELGNTFVYNESADGTKSITKTKSSEEEENIAAVYETDGHYSTVYLVALMLGMNNEKAKALADATEAPDTTIHSETKFELNDTWSHPTKQETIHSLTGGFHGVEEMFTAMQFLNAPINDTKKLGELLHRYGDTYAHSRLDNITPKDLATYNLKDNPGLEKEAIESWKGIKGESLSNKMVKYMPYFNYYVRKYGTAFLFDEKVQKNAVFHGKTLNQVLKEIYNLSESDGYVMYGAVETLGITSDHAFSDGSFPDKIYMRPEWYMSYVKNLTWLLAEKYNLDAKKLNIKLFEKMVAFAKKERCSLKGIMDYEIAKYRNKKEVYIPVFHTESLRLAAMTDEKIFSNYQEVALDVLEKTKKYLNKENRSYTVSVIKINKGYSGSGSYNNTKPVYKTRAYLIKLK